MWSQLPVGALGVDVGGDLVGRDLALGVGQRQHLVPRGLDGARLVYVDVSRVGRHDTLVGAQHGLYHGGVGLRAAREQVYLGLGRTARLAYEAACPRRISRRSRSRCVYRSWRRPCAPVSRGVRLPCNRCRNGTLLCVFCRFVLYIIIEGGHTSVGGMPASGSVVCGVYLSLMGRSSDPSEGGTDSSATAHVLQGRSPITSSSVPPAMRSSCEK